ncbi:MAG TPA: 4Fe-4S binding protein [Chloroflexi bacterium]|jgi:Pyruvate/2-oxoacid:ferredoxin oxidoreductase delta subunit|nr:4Fe-4S binding protein [Chloroflexota bacterium]
MSGRFPAGCEVLVLGSTIEAARSARELLTLGYGVHWASPDGPPADVPSPRPDLSIYERHTLITLDGHVGAFTATLSDEFGRAIHIEISAVVVATGSGQGPPPEIGGPAASPWLLSLSHAERRLTTDHLRENSLAYRLTPVALVLDLGEQTGKERATAALHLVQRLRRRSHAEIYCFYRDLKVDSPGLERLTRELRRDGVVFVRYRGPDLPMCEGDEGIVIDGPDGPVHARPVIVPERVCPRDDTAALAAALRVRLGEDGHFQPINVRAYRAGLASRRGIFFAGRCHMDCSLEEAEADAEAVVAAVDALLGRGYIKSEASPARVDAEKCIRCLTCVRSCPHAAVEIASYDGVTAARVAEPACFGCGICAAHCPVRAIEMVGSALPARLQGDPV